MREEASRVFGFVTIGIVLILGILAAVHMLSVSPLWTTEGAAWVQAISSIAAIWGALWIYHRQAETRTAETNVIADLAAAKFHPRAQHLLEELEELIDRLNGYDVLDMGPEELKHIYQRISSPPEWTLEELAALAPLPEDCALQFSTGLGALNATRLFLRNRTNDPQLSHDHKFRIRSASEASAMLQMTCEYLLRALMVMCTRIP